MKITAHHGLTWYICITWGIWKMCNTKY